VFSGFGQLARGLADILIEQLINKKNNTKKNAKNTIEVGIDNNY